MCAMTSERTRCVSIHWLGACAIAVGGIACVWNTGFAQEEHGRASSGEAYTAAPEDWVRVAPSDRATVLEMIADQTQGNYERIRSWKGTYHVRLRQLHPAEIVQAITGGAIDGSSGLWQELDFTMRFAIDMASGSIYRSKETEEMRWVRAGSNEVVTVPNAMPADERSVVTVEHYLRFDPKVVWPGFVTVKDFPEARDKRAAFREPPARAERQGMGDLMDPRSFFFWSGRGGIENGLRNLTGMLKGDLGNELKKKSNDTVILYEATAPDGMWYRLDETFEEPSPVQYLSAIFSPAAGLNAVALSLAADQAGERPLRMARWQWKLFNGVHVPVKTKELQYSGKSGQLSFDRETELQECVVNEPLEPSQFTYQGLGMEDGELVMDNINNACYVIEGAELRKVADFDEEYIAPGQSRGLGPVGRWFLTAVGVVGLMAVILFLRARRAET